MSKKRKSILNIAFGLLNLFSVTLMGILIPRMYIINYGSEINGIQNTIATVIIYLGLIEGGVGASANKSMFIALNNKDTNATNSVISAIHSKYLTSSKLYAALVLTFAIVSALFLRSNEVKPLVVFFMVLFSASGGLLSFLIQGDFLIFLSSDGRAYIISIISMCVTIVSQLSKLILLHAKHPIIEVYIIHAIIVCLSSLVYWIYQKRRYRWINKKASPNHAAVGQSKDAFIQQIASMICNNKDMIVISFLLRDLKSASVYGIYVLIYGTVKSIIVQIYGGLTFVLGQIVNSDQEKTVLLYDLFVVLSNIISYSMFGTAMLLSRSFISLYTAGSNDSIYINTVYPLLFSIVYILHQTRYIDSLLVQLGGHFQKTKNGAIIEMVISLAATMCTLKWLGVYSVLFGTFLSTIYRSVDLGLFVSHRILNYQAIHIFVNRIKCCLFYLPLLYIYYRIEFSIANYQQFIRYFFLLFPGLIVYFSLVNITMRRKALSKNQYIKVFVKHLLFFNNDAK